MDGAAAEEALFIVCFLVTIDILARLGLRELVLLPGAVSGALLEAGVPDWMVMLRRIPGGIMGVFGCSPVRALAKAFPALTNGIGFRKTANAPLAFWTTCENASLWQ